MARSSTLPSSVAQNISVSVYRCFNEAAVDGHTLVLLSYRIFLPSSTQIRKDLLSWPISQLIRPF
jgi:hypothetical protein